MDTRLVPDGGVYQLLLVLHLITVIGGFGGVVLDGLYGKPEAAGGGQGPSGPLRGRQGPNGPLSGRQGPSGPLSGRQGPGPPGVSEWLIYAVPVTGLLVVLVSEDRWQFSQAWVSLSFLLYLAAVGVMHVGRRLPGPVGGAVLNLLVVAVVVLMVTKPGA